MVRGDGEWWLRGLPVRRATSNPGSYAGALDLVQAGASAWLVVGLIDDHRWLSALGAVLAVAFIGVAASSLAERLRDRGPLRGESAPPAPWVSLVAVPLGGAGLYLAGTFAGEAPLQIAGLAVMALLMIVLMLSPRGTRS